MRHIGKRVQEGFEEQRVPGLQKSSDLKLVKHMLDVLDKQVQSIEAPPHNLHL